MKKIFITSLLLFTFSTLVACNENDDAQETPTVQIGNSPAGVINEETPELYRQWTIEEFGETIIAASTFWEDWWSMRGAFAWEHIDDSPWYYWVEQPEHPRSRGLGALLPSSGFESLADVALHLQQFYTDVWVNRELLGDEPTEFIDFQTFFGEPWAFEEYDGTLYVVTSRWGAMRPDWSTATHTLISQNDNIATVETVVTAYDHRGSGYEMPTATFRFVFYNGRIENGVGQWEWPETGDWASSDTPVRQGNYASVVDDMLLFAYRAEDVNLPSFDAIYETNVPNFGDLGFVVQDINALIGASQAIYDISLILIENVWDDVANQDGFTVTDSFWITETLQPGSGIVISGFVSETTVRILPWVGITFTTAPGERHFFAIAQDTSDINPNCFVLLNITEQML